MRKTLLVLGLAASIGLGCGSTSAVPLNAAAMKESATAAAAVQLVQYSEQRTKHGVVKCYRDLVIGPYRCHHFRNGWVSLPF